MGFHCYFKFSKVGDIHDPPTSRGVFDVDKIGNLDV